jgi:hypothetical protein
MPDFRRTAKTLNFSQLPDEVTPSSKANQRMGPGTPLSVRRVRTVIVLLHLSLTALERADEWSGRGPDGTLSFSVSW